jgi:hypothetical protein
MRPTIMYWSGGLALLFRIQEIPALNPDLETGQLSYGIFFVFLSPSR